MAINFSTNNDHFSIKPAVVQVEILKKKKKIQYFWFEISLLQDSKQKETYLRWVKYFKNLKGMVILTLLAHFVKLETIF